MRLIKIIAMIPVITPAMGKLLCWSIELLFENYSIFSEDFWWENGRINVGFLKSLW